MPILAWLQPLASKKFLSLQVASRRTMRNRLLFVVDDTYSSFLLRYIRANVGIRKLLRPTAPLLRGDYPHTARGGPEGL